MHMNAVLMGDKNILSPGAGVLDVCEPPDVQEQQVLLLWSHTSG